jgi:hypothetical protein
MDQLAEAPPGMKFNGRNLTDASLPEVLSQLPEGATFVHTQGTGFLRFGAQMRICAPIAWTFPACGPWSCT